MFIHQAVSLDSPTAILTGVVKCFAPHAGSCCATHTVFAATLSAHAIIESIAVVDVFLSYHSAKAEEDGTADNE